MTSNPDWARYGAKPPNQFQKVGDPTRWGATDNTNIVNNSFQESTAQILNLVTRDPYSRPWSLLGTLSMPVSTWNVAQMIASVVLFQGVGQTQLRQEIALWIGTGSAGGPGGLAYDQNSDNGGPYITSDVFFKTNVAGVSIAYETRAFSIVGGLIGQSIGMHARYGVLADLSGDLPSAGQLTLIAAPIAAASGL
jgi:hypothetical protein